MPRPAILFVLLLPALGPMHGALAQGPEGPDVVVVCPTEWRDDVQPWIAHRREQGHAVELLEPAEARQLQRQIRRRLDPGDAVLLVGNVPPNSGKAGPVLVHGDPAGAKPEGGGRVAGPTVPTWYVPATVLPQVGGEPYIATDAPYADLDDDGLPDLAVGRFPADSQAELAAMVDKTLAYERESDFGPWRRQIRVVASSGGFGPLIDGAIERVTRQFLSEEVPPEYVTDVSFADWHSPYCPNLFALREHTVGTLTQASLAWVYLGHGRPDRLVAAPMAPLPALSVLAGEDAARIATAQPRPVAFLLACYTAALDAPGECLAESLVQAPGGPVAVLGGTRLTMPYGMAVLGTEMLHQWFERPSGTLGGMWMRAQRAMLGAPGSHRASVWLDAIAWPLHPLRGQLGQERREHVQLFQLLGDPLLRIRQPQPVPLHVAEVVQAGERLRVDGVSPVAGRAVVELICQRDRLTVPLEPRTEITADPAIGLAMEAQRRRANDRRWCHTEIDVPAGPFSVGLEVPQEARGPGYARVFVQGKGDYALGSAAVQIE